MQTYTVEKTDNSITLGFKDADMTLITPLIKELNDDKNVKIVRFIEEHPELCDRKLYVEVKKGDALKAVEKATKAVAKYFSKISE